MKLKDKRYSALKAYIDSGGIKSFAEVFDIVPKSVFVKDSGINYVRLMNKINNPEKFTVKDILLLAELIGIDCRKLFDLIAKAINKKPNNKK
ncbi:MAG: hypothetical protein GXC73_11950 [Chitinophagaceae bacterium]|nr:hypothetical protein [Chitinophagaceae bacterium]